MAWKAMMGAAALVALVGMQVFGRSVLWEALWGEARIDEEVRLVTMLWWGWTAVQAGFGVVVGISMYGVAMGVIRGRRAALEREVSGVEVGGGGEARASLRGLEAATA